MQIHLRNGEKLYVNGAVIRADRKVSLELLNDATFLLESHVITPAQATTPGRQLYFAIQTMLMQPLDCDAARALANRLIQDLRGEKGIDADILLTIAHNLASGRHFDALRQARRLTTPDHAKGRADQRKASA